MWSKANSSSFLCHSALCCDCLLGLIPSQPSQISSWPCQRTKSNAPDIWTSNLNSKYLPSKLILSNQSSQPAITKPPMNSKNLLRDWPVPVPSLAASPAVEHTPFTETLLWVTGPWEDNESAIIPWADLQIPPAKHCSVMWHRLECHICCSWHHCKVPKLCSNTLLAAKALKETSNN